MVKKIPVEQRKEAILKRTPMNGMIAEVGVLVGRLSSALLYGRKDIQLVMVDNWKSQDEQPQSYLDTNDKAARLSKSKAEEHKEMCRGIANHFYGRAHIREGDSVSVARQISDATFDIVFLDADHSEQGVKADIEAWLPKVKPGGWIGGHDYDNPEQGYDFTGVKRAVDAAFGDRVELDGNFTWWVKV